MNEQTDRRTKERMKRHPAFEPLSDGQYTEYCYQLRSIDETRLYTYVFEQAIHALFWHMAVLGIFLIQLFPNWTACSPITYTNTTMYFNTFQHLGRCSTFSTAMAEEL